MTKEHNIVSVSGGKDSTAMLLLAIERGIRNMVEWSQTGRGGHSFDWIKVMGEDDGPDGPACSSVYGLCE